MSRRRRKKAAKREALLAEMQVCVLHLHRPKCLCEGCIDRRVRERRA